jgi:hypothetical protein
MRAFHVLWQASLSQVFQENDVAHRVACHKAKPIGECFVLGHGDGFAGHGLGHACSFSVAAGDDGVFHLAVDLVLSPIGGSDKAVQTREVEEETDQPHTARTDLDTDEVEGSNAPMEEG